MGLTGLGAEGPGQEQPPPHALCVHSEKSCAPRGMRRLPEEPPQFIPANVEIPKWPDLICTQEAGTLDLIGKPLNL